MDVKLINPFIDALVQVMPQLGFDVPKRVRMSVQQHTCTSLGVSVIVGFTKGLRGNVVYNLAESSAKYVASKMMMGMPIADLNEMAQSALAEISNMLTANAATNLSSLGMSVDISTPSVTIGNGFKIKISDSQFLVVVLDVGGGNLIELNLAVQ